MIKLAVCVVHAAHIPARVPLMKRLRQALGVAEFVERDEYMRALSPIPGAPEVVAYHEETTRGPWWIWHELTLRFFVEAKAVGATHCLTLQDDVIPSSTFWEQLRALLEGRPKDVICLDCAHTAARPIFFAGGSGYTTPDGLIGIGHVEPIAIVEDFARWRLKEVVDGTLSRMSEDVLFGAYCMHREIPIFAPVPCILDHDLDITSTNDGFDDHWYRKPQVTMREIERLDEKKAAELRANTLDPAWWAREVPHVGRFYDNANHLSLILKDEARAAELVEKYAEDKTPKEYARFWSRVAATA